MLCFFFLMIRRPPRSTLDRSSAASDVYKRQAITGYLTRVFRSPEPSRDGRSITVAETLDRAVARLDSDLGEQPAPVSYTHLRAHETVLDLVCRLLLAKKNNNTHTHTTHNTQHSLKPLETYSNTLYTYVSLSTHLITRLHSQVN